MSFVFPYFLAALATLAIPIIIHLFFFRRFRRIYFTNVRFLKEVKEETSNRQRLRNLLVLLMRCLAIAMMVLAFAQPFLPRNSAVKQGQKSVSVFIDNSFSMNALSQDAPLLELAKQRARDVVSAYAPDDVFQILTNDFEGRDQRLVGKEDALNRIEEIRISPASRELAKVLVRQQQCLATGKADNRVAFVVSDFQENISDLKSFNDSLLEVNLIPIRSVQERNISIDSAWFEKPVQILREQSRLLIKVSNRSDEAIEDARLSLRHDGQSKPIGTLNIRARASKIDTVPLTILHPGWHEAKLSVTDFPVQFDDDYYLSFYVAERINMLSLNNLQGNKYLKNALLGANYFHLDDADARALDYSKFPNYQLIILNEVPTISSGLAQELRTFVQNGGNVLAFPPQTADLNAYNALLQGFNAAGLGAYEPTPRQASQINTEEFVFRDVFQNKSANLRLPATLGNFKIAPNAGEHILSYRDGSAMLSKIPFGEGALYLCAAPLDDKINDLVRNAEIFVPLLFKTAIAGSKGRQIAYTIGKDEVLEAEHRIAATGEMVYKLSLSKDDNGKTALETDPATPNTTTAEFIPEQRIIGSKVLLTPGTQVRNAGWYRLGLNADTTLSEFAFNFDRKESDLRYLDDDALAKDLPKNIKVLSGNTKTNFAQLVGEENKGIVLWRWCVIFALLFLALEVLFLRLWKV